MNDTSCFEEILEATSLKTAVRPISKTIQEQDMQNTGGELRTDDVPYNI